MGFVSHSQPPLILSHHDPGPVEGSSRHRTLIPIARTFVTAIPPSALHGLGGTGVHSPFARVSPGALRSDGVVSAGNKRTAATASSLPTPDATGTGN